MNPKDRVTLYYIADMIPEEWGIEVASHIAGVQKIIHLPHPRVESGSTAHTMRILPLPGATMKKELDVPDIDQLMLTVWTAPVFANPNELFRDLLDVIVDETVVENPASVVISIHNGEGEPCDFSDETEIHIDFPDAEIIRILIQGEGEALKELDLTRRAKLVGPHTIVIRPPHLDRGETLNVCAIISGDYSSVKVSCKDFLPNQAMWVELVLDDLVGNNLAKMQPQLLLSNQKAYLLWQRLAPKLHRYRAMVSDYLGLESGAEDTGKK
jgi:hypothetical protein